MPRNETPSESDSNVASFHSSLLLSFLSQPNLAWCKLEVVEARQTGSKQEEEEEGNHITSDRQAAPPPCVAPQAQVDRPGKWQGRKEGSREGRAVVVTSACADCTLHCLPLQPSTTTTTDGINFRSEEGRRHAGSAHHHTVSKVLL